MNDIFDYQEECPFCNKNMGFSFKRMHLLSHKKEYKNVRLMKCKSACCGAYIYMRMKESKDTTIKDINNIVEGALSMSPLDNNEDINYYYDALIEIERICKNY